MACYVDELGTYGESQIKAAARRYGERWCHLFADTDGELHEFAAKLRLLRQWAQEMDQPEWKHHYDLTPGKRAQAIHLGAIPVQARDYLTARLDRHRRGLPMDYIETVGV